MNTTVKPFASTMSFDSATNTVSTKQGLEDLNDDPFLQDPNNWRYDGIDGFNAEGEQLSDDNLDPHRHFFEIVDNGKFTEKYIAFTCPFAFGDVFSIPDCATGKTFAVIKTWAEFNPQENTWQWMASVVEVENAFKMGDRFASVGFVREDGDFELLATFNNNTEYLSDYDFYCIVTRAMRQIAKRGEITDLVALNTEYANDVVELDN